MCKKIKIIVSKILQLLFDILLFTYKMGNQIILPGKKQKGNILSTTFNYFIGIAEKIITFELGTDMISAAFRNKDIQKIFLLTGVFLFSISLFEWSIPQQKIIPSNNTELHCDCGKIKNTNKPAKSTPIMKNVLSKHFSLYSNNLCYSENKFFQLPYKYLYFKNIRI